jgi:hypothetical protein
MTEVEMIAKYERTKERASLVGLTIKHDTLEQFTIADVPKANGLICLETLGELEKFIYGYELGCNRLEDAKDLETFAARKDDEVMEITLDDLSPSNSSQGAPSTG